MLKDFPIGSKVQIFTINTFSRKQFFCTKNDKKIEFRTKQLVQLTQYFL